MIREENKKRIRYDIILTVSLLIVGISALLIMFALQGRGNPAKDGAVVVVEIDRVRVAEYPLYEDGIYVLNGGTNTLPSSTARLGCPKPTARDIRTAL